MGQVIVACRMLELELAAAMERTGCHAPVLWLPPALHDSPRRLNACLQETLDGIGAAERVLVAMGFCGNAVVGLRNGPWSLVLPRVDDCVTLLLGSPERRQAINSQQGTYFLTKGWLEGEKSLEESYDHAVRKYGRRMADELYRELLRNYRQLALLDTGAYPLEEVAEKTARLAGKLHLRHQVLEGTLDYLSQLLTGPWPGEKFLTVAPGSTLRMEDLFL